jgi:hypothetical protein
MCGSNYRNSFSARCKALKEVRKYILKYQIPDKTVVNALFRTFNRDKLQRATESANKQCSVTRRVFPYPTLKQIVYMQFNYYSWNNTPITLVGDAPSDKSPETFI